MDTIMHILATDSQHLITAPSESPSCPGMSNNGIIIAVNIIFLVCLDQRDAFLSAIHGQVEHLRALALQSSGASLIQAVLGDDLEEPTTFHCHLKFRCSSLEQARGALKEHPIFLKPPWDGWEDFEASQPFEKDPIVVVWALSESSSDDMPNPKNNVPNHQPTFCLNANLYIRPERREEFLRVIESARSQSIREPLCAEYNFGESIETSNTFHVHQEYIGDDGGKEGFELHADTPHYQRWKDFSNHQEPFTEEPVGYPFRCSTRTSTDTSTTLRDTLLLDGGNGHELKLRGITDDGSFLAGLLANERQPDVVKSVHRDFGHSGCRILTTNSFVAVPERIQKDILKHYSAGVTSEEKAQQRTRELIHAAVQCAREVAEEHGSVRVAGTVAPLTECYMPLLVPKDVNILVDGYKFLLSVLIEEGVDILLAETLSTTREAVAIVRALAQVVHDRKAASCNNNKPLLAISMTIDDFERPTALRSGERLDLAIDSILQESIKVGIPLWGIGVNCASPRAVTNAVPCIRVALEKSSFFPPIRIMAYANAFRTTTSEWLASLEDDSKVGGSGEHLPIEVVSPPDEYDLQGFILADVYARYAQAWRDAGVSVIGGCCGCSPSHLKAIAKKIGL